MTFLDNWKIHNSVDNKSTSGDRKSIKVHMRTENNLGTQRQTNFSNSKSKINFKTIPICSYLIPFLCYFICTLAFLSQVPTAHALDIRTTQTIAIGSVVNAICEGKKVQNWKYPNGSYIPFSNSRVSVSNLTDFCNRVPCLTLTFNPFLKSDQGDYVCEAAGGGIASVSIRANTVSFVDTPPEQSFVRGARGLITCKIEGEETKMLWRRNGATITDDDNYKIVKDGLEVRNFTKDDDANYTCIAFNPKTITTKQFFIKVNVWYPATIKRTKQQIYAVLGQSLNLTCETEGNPKPRIEWYKNNYADLPLQNIFTDNQGLSVLSLQINNEMDYAMYTCRAENNMGVASELKFTVQSAKAPSRIKGLELLQTKAYQIKLKVLYPEDDGGRPIESYKMRYKAGDQTWDNAPIKTISPDDPIIVIEDLTPNTKYDFEVVAVNSVNPGLPYTQIISTNNDITASNAPSIQLFSLIWLTLISLLVTSSLLY